MFNGWYLFTGVIVLYDINYLFISHYDKTNV